MSRDINDVKNQIEQLRKAGDRLEMFTNIRKILSVNNSINEAMGNVLTIETSILLTPEELLELLNEYINMSLVHINMIDKITGLMDSRKKPLEEKKSMAI